MSAGANAVGTVRHVSSKWRIVALVIVPARNIPDALLWIASKASLLNLGFAGMANLRQFLGFQLQLDFGVGLAVIKIGQITKAGQFGVGNIVAVVFGEQVGIDPIAFTFGENDAAVPVLVEPLLE